MLLPTTQRFMPTLNLPSQPTSQDTQTLQTPRAHTALEPTNTDMTEQTPHLWAEHAISTADLALSSPLMAQETLCAKEIRIAISGEDRRVDLLNSASQMWIPAMRALS